MTQPIVYDFFTGLHGWLEAFLLEGYRCIGYDIEDMCASLGVARPAGIEFRQRDVRSIHGSECRDATVLVASPPCQAYSYRAMPWKRAKALPPPDNTLFNECFRIQREASEAAGRYIPLIVENVRGAQKWVGQARWHCGSFFLWGDVPALMPIFKKFKAPGQNWNAFKETGKVSAHWRMQGEKPPSTRLWQDQDGVKVGNASARTFSECRALAKANPEMDPHNFWHNSREDGVKFSASSSREWFDGKPKDKMLGDKGPAAYGSRSRSRKAASAMIAKIPYPLALHIARVFKPVSV